MQIRITINVYPEYADPDHETGLSEGGFETIYDVLTGFGDIDFIERVDE